jgi:hypothetical protein
MAGASINDEPSVEVLPPQQAAQIAVVPTRVLLQPTATPPLPLPTPAAPAVTLRIFDRPLVEVLTWTAIMIGALAIIGLLVALIWQYANRGGPTP